MTTSIFWEVSYILVQTTSHHVSSQIKHWYGIMMEWRLKLMLSMKAQLATSKTWILVEARQLLWPYIHCLLLPNDVMKFYFLLSFWTHTCHAQQWPTPTSCIAKISGNKNKWWQQQKEMTMITKRNYDVTLHELNFQVPVPASRNTWLLCLIITSVIKPPMIWLSYIPSWACWTCWPHF